MPRALCGHARPNACARGGCASAIASSVRSSARSSSTRPTKRACRQVAETLWTLGERVARRSRSTRRTCCGSSRSASAEIRLARIDPGYATTSTAARADAFILPDSLQFAEYNGESPAGAGYSQGLAELFADEPLMARFRERFDARLLPAGRGAARGAGRELSRVGRHRVAAADGDRRLARGADLQRVRDPARRVHGARRADDHLRPARSRVRRVRVSRPAAGLYATAGASTSSTAACSSTTSSRARTSAARWSTPTSSAPSASPTRCAARSRTRRRSSPC